MRLIDADGLKGVEDSVLCSRDYARGWNDCIAEARHAPTVDAEPVRHLRRSDVYEPFYQLLGMPSASDEWIALRCLVDDLVERCGAKMDKEANND